jgi:hypothetical protein
VLVLAVAGGAWALFGRGTEKKTGTTAIGPVAASTTPTTAPIGPKVPGLTSTPKPTSTKPVAAPITAAPSASKPAPTAAATTAAPAPTKAPAPSASPSTSPAPQPSTPPVVTPPVTAPQQGGTVAKKAYTFRVARGDTLWGFTTATLKATGRSTSNANVAAYVAKLYQANRSTIGSNPDLIFRDMKIVWPNGL